VIPVLAYFRGRRAGAGPFALAVAALAGSAGEVRRARRQLALSSIPLCKAAQQLWLRTRLQSGDARLARALGFEVHRCTPASGAGMTRADVVLRG
jgi:hypothetical protein